MKIIFLHEIFKELAFILSKNLNCEIVETLKPKINDEYLIIGAHNKTINLLDNKKKFNLTYHILQTEQLNNNIFNNKYYLELLRNSKVYDWSNYNISKLKNIYNINCYGMYSFYFLNPNDFIPFNDRPIDFLFIGSMNLQRDRLKKLLVTLYPDKKIIWDYNNSFYEPLKLKNLLSKTKYVLNLPYYKDSVLEEHRINNALICGCVCLSPFSYDEELNEIYKDYVYFGNLDKLIKNIFNLKPKKEFIDYPKNLLEVF